MSHILRIIPIYGFLRYSAAEFGPEKATVQRMSLFHRNSRDEAVVTVESLTSFVWGRS